MIVIRLDEEYTPELKEAVRDLMAKFNVVSFGVEGEGKADVTVRSGATGSDLSTAISAAVDKVQRGKPAI